MITAIERAAFDQKKRGGARSQTTYETGNGVRIKLSMYASVPITNRTIALCWTYNPKVYIVQYVFAKGNQSQGSWLASGIRPRRGLIPPAVRQDPNMVFMAVRYNQGNHTNTFKTLRSADGCRMVRHPAIRSEMTANQRYVFVVTLATSRRLSWKAARRRPERP